MKCYKCNGTGYYDIDNECPYCGGTGEINDIIVPPLRMDKKKSYSGDIDGATKALEEEVKEYENEINAVTIK